MKWAKVIEQNKVKEWADHYISYKCLKKIIKKLQRIHDSTTRDSYDILQSQFDQLVQQVTYALYNYSDFRIYPFVHLI